MTFKQGDIFTQYTFPDWFLEYMNENPKVYEKFEQLALTGINAGIERVSGRYIVETIRWNTRVAEKNSLFKIDDHVSPYLTRFFITKYPHYESRFELRKVSKKSFGS